MFDIIKKQNGEHFAKVIRNYDNGIFDIPNIDKIVKYAGKEAEPIINYLISLKDIQVRTKNCNKSPFELLYEAGYHAEYADTLEKQNDISKYFAFGEELCTFKDPERYKKYYIINAVKFNADKINRADFRTPIREDEYGTSVISIQMLKSGGFISIKNRYNHSVDNADNTYNSNPDNIIDGLSEALMKHFNVDFSSKEEKLPAKYIFMAGQILKYNYEVNNVYYGENFIAQDGQIKEINKSSELMMDYFIFDMKTKHFFTQYQGVYLHYLADCFPAVLEQEIQGKKLQIQKDKSTGNIVLFANKKPVLELNHGNIIRINLYETKHISKKFLYHDETALSFKSDSVLEIGNSFLYLNKCLEELYTPNLQITDDFFLQNNRALKKLHLDNLKETKTCFLYSNEQLTDFEAKNLITAGPFFLYRAKNIENINFPNLLNLGDWALSESKSKSFNAPKLKSFGTNSKTMLSKLVARQR